MSMVLDEVESAGTRTQDCLPRPGSPGWSAAAGGGGGGASDSWARELLRRGWGLTRTAAIAGAAATAAPVVAPPLIVLSAAGVALSVPFAAYLASIAAANHLTGALLRSCQPPPPPPYIQEYDDLEQEFLDASEEYGQEAPAFGHLDTEMEQGTAGEEDGSDTSLPLSRDPEALADDELEGEFSAPSMPLLQEEDTLVQRSGEDEFSLLNSGQPLLQSDNWKGKEDGVYSKNNEEDDRTMEENRPAKETVLQGFYFPELGVPASGGDHDNVVQEKGEDEFSVQNSGQQSFQFQSKNFDENEEDDGRTMEGNKFTKETVSQEAKAFGYLDTEIEQAIIKEEKESDTSPLLPRDPGVSESSAPAFADVEVEEVQGEFSAQESGHDSYMSYRGNDTEGHTPLEGSGSTQKETLPRGSGVSASAKPLFPEKDNVIQEEGNDEEAVQVSGEQSFRSKNWNEKKEDVCSKKEEGDGKTMQENKSMEETVSRGLCFPESCVPASGEEDDNVVQEKGEGKFAAQHSGQRSFLSKNLNEEVEEEGKTTEENKTTKETAFYESSVPASGDEDNVVQEKREGEISVQNSGQLPFQSKMWNEKVEDGKTTEENKSTEARHSKGSYFPEWSVPASGDEDKKGEGEFSVHNIGQYSLSSDIGDKKEHDIRKEAKRSAEDMPPRDSESPTPVFHGEDDTVQDKEGFEVAVQGVLEEASSNTDLVTAEVVDSQVEIIGTAAPESEVLPPSTDLVIAEVVDVEVEIIATAAPDSEMVPPSNLLVGELHPDLVTREVNDVYVGIVAAVEPESEVLHESNLAIGASTADPGTGEISDVQVNVVAAAKPEDEVLHESDLAAYASTADFGTGEISDVQVNIVAAAKPEDEVLPLSNLTECESQVVVETPHVGDILGIAAIGHNVKDSGGVDKQGMECCFVPVASMHDNEGIISSGSTPYFSTMGEEIIDLSDQSSDVGYTMMNEAFRSRVVAESEARYTEEQLREQLDTIRTITGYGAVPSSTLEGEMAGLYVFVGVEPPVGSSDTSDRLMALSAELRFLKSIIGVD
ncbi:uncharacterized protein LOC123407423 [Hordeum vulgare subsp. vulgare]|uniref:uncharacterized protein LOC123407423 n=1 Tax=Hordeum vulgare subsp. vulgare TaxID=112509 RepID=UPI001D1A4F23|nr:uncharacterized protein LOC123407423 [Hordeum vulgare subsp. vulgare]